MGSESLYIKCQVALTIGYPWVHTDLFFLIDMLIATSLTKMKTMTQLSQSILKILHLKSNKKFQLKIELSHCLYFFVPPQCHMPSVS